MCVITTGHCRFCSRSNTRRIECKEKCGDWQEDSWGENSVCQKCYDETLWLTAGPELSKGDIRRVLNGSSLVDPSMMTYSTPPFDPQKWAQPIPPSPTDTQPKSPDIAPDLSLKKHSTMKMNSVIESPHASPILSEDPSSSRQLESTASSSNLPFETSSHFSGSLPNQAASTSNVPPSPADTQPKSPNIVPDLSLRKKSTTEMNSVIEFPHASLSLSGNPSSSGQLESMASSSNLPFETSSHLSGSLPNRAAATSKHLSKSGSSSNPSQRSPSLGTSLFKNIFANPSKSKSKTLASDSRSETPWPQAPGASSSKQRSTTAATTKKETGPDESHSPADFPKKPSSCFHPAGS